MVFRTSVTVLGVAQDGGIPHPGCHCETCESQFQNGNRTLPTSICVRHKNEIHIIDVSRDLDTQARRQNFNPREITDIWLTHAHLGHVDGLGLFGREVMALKGVRLHASESMMSLFDETPRWAAMIEQGVFVKHQFESNKKQNLSPNFSFTPISVPHRNEFSDNHAFVVRGHDKSLLHLPDHDDWDKTLKQVGEDNIRDWLTKIDIDIALIDGTFWESNEIARQDNVPHPTITESIARLGERKEDDIDIRFIHLNHTNPALSWDKKDPRLHGWSIANEGDKFSL